MYESLIGEKVTVIVATRGQFVFEYNGTLSSVTEDDLELTNVSISHLLFTFQYGPISRNLSKYKDNLKKVIVNKNYVISCDKE